MRDALSETFSETVRGARGSLEAFLGVFRVGDDPHGQDRSLTHTLTPFQVRPRSVSAAVGEDRQHGLDEPVVGFGQPPGRVGAGGHGDLGQKPGGGPGRVGSTREVTASPRSSRAGLTF